MCSIIKVLLVLHLSFQTCKMDNNNLSILVFQPNPDSNHFKFFQPLLQELINRGHALTVISHFPNQLPYSQDINLSSNKSAEERTIDVEAIQGNYLSQEIAQFARMRRLILEMCEDALTNENVQQLINSKSKFDVVITEALISDCSLGFVHKFNASLVSISPHPLLPWANERMGNVDNPNCIPGYLTCFFDEMNLIQRVFNTVHLNLLKSAYRFFYVRPIQSLLNKVFGDEFPSLEAVGRDSSVMLVNTHYTLHGNRPTLPNIVEIAGIHLENSENELPSDVEKFLDEAKEGVLYISFGNAIDPSTMSKKKLYAIFQVFSSIPRKILWKCDLQMPRKFNNVMVKSWVPQLAVLSHANVKAFLNHGGIFGVIESVFCAVPMVIVPFYGVQFQNAFSAEARKVAVVIRYQDFKEKTLNDALDLVFNDTK